VVLARIGGIVDHLSQPDFQLAGSLMPTAPERPQNLDYIGPANFLNRAATDLGEGVDQQGWTANAWNGS
jgi:hypothetical protein